jgi:formate hydrogenlyase subunit 4
MVFEFTPSLKIGSIFIIFSQIPYASSFALKTECILFVITFPVTPFFARSTSLNNSRHSECSVNQKREFYLCENI